MGRAASKKLKDFMRGQEYRRKQEILNAELLAIQEQFTRDYLNTHSQIDRKNKNYPVTEKVLHGSPEELKAILTSKLRDTSELKINPDDFPEGLVIRYGEDFFDALP